MAQVGSREVAVTVKHLKAVLDYMWAEEERHYEEASAKEKKKHIFNSLMHLNRQLKRQNG